MDPRIRIRRYKFFKNLLLVYPAWKMTAAVLRIPIRRIHIFWDSRIHLWLLFDFLPLKNNVNVASKSNSKKNLEETNFLLPFRLTKIAGSRAESGAGFGSRSGSVSQRHGSADPCLDPGPYQNVTDPRHCLADEFFIDWNISFIFYSRIRSGACAWQLSSTCPCWPVSWVWSSSMRSWTVSAWPGSLITSLL